MSALKEQDLVAFGCVNGSVIMELGQNRKSKQVKRIDVKQPEKREEDNSEKDSDRQSTENMHTISDSVQSIEYLLFINRKNHSTFPYTTTFRLYHWATAR